MYYDEDSDQYFEDLGELAEHYDECAWYYSCAPLPRKVFECNSNQLYLGTAETVAIELLEDFKLDQSKQRKWFNPEVTADYLVQSATEDFYSEVDDDFLPDVAGVEDLQRAIDIFTAINKPFWLLGGDTQFGLWILNRALRQLEKENGKAHRLWYPAKRVVEMNDRVWRSLKLKNWQLIDGDWMVKDEN